MSRLGDAVVEIPPSVSAEKQNRSQGATQSCGNLRPLAVKVEDDVDEVESDREERDDQSEEDSFGWFGRLYKDILSLNFFLRYTIYIVPIGILLAIPIIVLNSIKGRVPVGPVRLIGLFIWLELVWLTLWGSNMAARAIPPTFRLFSGFLSKDTKKYSDFLKALETPITLLIWSACAWGSVALLYRFPYISDGVSVSTLAAIPWNEPGSPWTETMKRVFLATIPVAAIYLAEKMIVEWVTVNYHETQFEKKIQETNRWTSLITDLYQTSTSLFPNYCSTFQAEDDIIHSTMPPAEEVGSSSSTLRKIGRVGVSSKSSIKRTMHVFTTHQRGAIGTDSSVVNAALENQKTTTALARRIWLSLTQDGARDLYEEDITRAIDKSRREEAQALFLKLDFNRNGAVSLEEMTGLLSDVARERKAVAASMVDIKSSIDSFSAILAVIGLVGMAIVYAAFFSTSFLRNLQLITTAVLSLSFAFAGTVQEFAQSFVFLFIKHPYDVGDRIEKDDDKVELIVEKICLLHTIFRRVLDNRLVQIPNTVNSIAAITNLSRSRNLKQRIHIQVNINTSEKQIASLQSELTSFVQSSTLRRDYTPDVKVMITAIDAYEMLDLVIVYGHKSNWSRESLRLTRRNRFMAEVLRAMRSLVIKPPGGTAAGSGSREYPQYTVEITKEEAQAAAKEAREKLE